MGGAAEGKGKEVAGKVDVGKVAEKVVKNVRLSFSTSFLSYPRLYPLSSLTLISFLSSVVLGK